MKLLRFFLFAYSLGIAPIEAMFTPIDDSLSSFDDQEVEEMLRQINSISMEGAAEFATSPLRASESNSSLEVADDAWLYDEILGEDQDLLAVDQESPVQSRKAIFVATAEEAPSSPYSPHRKDLMRHGQYLARVDELINDESASLISGVTYEDAVRTIKDTVLLEQFKSIQNGLTDAQKNLCFPGSNEVAAPEEFAAILLMELSKLTTFINEICEKKFISRNEYLAILSQSGKFIDATIKLINSVNFSQARVHTLQSQAMPKNRLKTSKKAYERYYRPLLDRSINGISIIVNDLIPAMQTCGGNNALPARNAAEISKANAELLDIKHVFLPHKYLALCQKVQDLKEWIAQDFAYSKIHDLARLIADITAMISEADELSEISSIAFGRQYAALLDELNGICQIAQPVFEHIEQQQSDVIGAKLRLDIAQIIRAVMSLHIPAQFEYGNELSDSLRVLLEEPSISARSSKKLQHSASAHQLQRSSSRLSISPASSMWHIDSQDCHYPRGQTPVSYPEWLEYDSSDAMALVEDKFIFMMTDHADARIGAAEGECIVKQLRLVDGRVAELSHRQNSFMLTSHSQWVSKLLLQYCGSVLSSFIDVDISEHVEVFKIDPTDINEIIESASSMYYNELLSTSVTEYADFVQTSSSLYKILQRLLADLKSINVDQRYSSKKFIELDQQQKAQMLHQLENILKATALATTSSMGVVYYLQDKFDLLESQSQQTQAQLVTLFLLGQIFKVVNFTHLIVADLFGNDEITLQGVKKLLHDAQNYGEFHAEWAQQALHNMRPASTTL